MTARLTDLAAQAFELGRRAEITGCIAAALAQFVDRHTPSLSYACGFARDGAVVSGTGATAAVVFAIDGDDVIAIDAPAARKARTLIGWRDAAEIALFPGSGERLTGVGHAIARATVVAAAEAAGVARGALDSAVSYASAREQFGAPIGTYQALAHRLVDMAIATEAAELAVEQATVEPMALHASRAKLCADHAARLATEGLHQIHGGVGYYADQAPPAFFARALALSYELGDARHHRRVVARHYRLVP